MQDQMFGKLTWDDECWEGKVSFPYLSKFGRVMDEADEEDPTPQWTAEKGPTKGMLEARGQLEEMISQSAGKEAELLKMAMGFADRMAAAREQSPPGKKASQPPPSEEELQWRQGRLDLYIDMDGKRAKPSKAQRAAWQTFLERGDAIWDEIAKHSLAIYLRQRRMRVELFKRVYGTHLLDRRLPDIKTAAAMKKLIRPVTIRIKPPLDKKAATADISIHVAATWHGDGFGVVIRDGRIAEFGAVLDVVHTSPKPRETIEHKTFGTLRRIPDDDPFEVIDQWQMPTEQGRSGFDKAKRGGPWPWEGRTRFDAMLDYAMIADDRAKYMRDRAHADRPESHMAWEFADGEFDLRVYAGRGKEPSDAQAKAFERFRADENRLAAELIKAIFAQYQEVWQIRRELYKDRHVEDNIPEPTSPDGLRDLMQLRHIHVHEPDSQGRVTIAMQFVCTWDYDGFTAFCRDGEIAEWGTWKDARPA
jgi:hypothetical protein